MSVIAIGFIPAAPLLIPALAGDDVARDADLRDHVRAVVADLVRAADKQPGAIMVVVGPADEASAYGGTYDFAPLGLPLRGAGSGRLPTALGIGAWFLDEAGYTGGRTYVGVPDRTPAAACAALGRSLDTGGDIALLVVGDGTARRGEKAPGWFDARAEAFDDHAARALASGNPLALLDLDADLARDLQAAGRAPWQVAAGAAGRGAWRGQVLWDAAPYGVGYFVATWLAAPSA